MASGHSEFHYSSTAYGTAHYIVPALGSASAGIVKKVRITDLKATCGGTGRTLKVFSKASGNFDPLEFDLPANSVLNYTWITPYPLDVTSTTGAITGIVASASGAGVKFSVSGYIEKHG